jgi:hypothetical protein
MDLEKMKAIMDSLVLRNAHEVRRLMGISSYYRRFVEVFSKIAKPITTLQYKGFGYEWTNECDIAFIKLNRLLNIAPILHVLDMENYFTICTYATKNDSGLC